MKFRHLLLPLAVTLSPVAFGATNGSLGSTSTGETIVSVTVDDLVQVRVQQDVSMGTATAGTDSTGSTGLCIYRNGSGNIDLTLTSANPDASDNFRMTDGTNFLPYSVDISGADTVATVTSGVATSLANADSTSSTCGSTYPHSLNVTVNSTDLDAAAAGSYSDTVEVLVSPI